MDYAGPCMVSARLASSPACWFLSVPYQQQNHIERHILRGVSYYTPAPVGYTQPPGRVQGVTGAPGTETGRGAGCTVNAQPVYVGGVLRGCFRHGAGTTPRETPKKIRCGGGTCTGCPHNPGAVVAPGRAVGSPWYTGHGDKTRATGQPIKTRGNTCTL